MFSPTSAAARQIQQAANGSVVQEMALCVAVHLESDGSLQYGMGCENPKDDDLKLNQDGAPALSVGRLRKCSTPPYWTMLSGPPVNLTLS
jgi:Fe-S cluster assembly iron-binding protein IscA